MKPVFSRIGQAALGFVGRHLLRALFHTLRIRRTGQHNLVRLREEGTPVIFVFWHGRLLPLIHVHRHEGTVVLVSEHRDGEYIAGLLHHFGFGTVRGSSTRGGVRGLKGLIRAAREGRDLAVTPDGPQGPSRELKLGALTVARMTGLPLVPVGVGVTAAWRTRSWDGFLVPKPFSTVQVAYGPASFVSRSADQEEIDGVVRSLKWGLVDLSAQVGDTELSAQVGDTEPSAQVGDTEPSAQVGDTELSAQVGDTEPS